MHFVISALCVILESFLALRNRPANVGVQPWICLTFVYVLINSHGTSKSLSLSIGTKSRVSFLFYAMLPLCGLYIIWSILLQVRFSLKTNTYILCKDWHITFYSIFCILGVSVANLEFMWRDLHLYSLFSALGCISPVLRFYHRLFQCGYNY